MKRIVIIVLLIAAVGVGGYLWWERRHQHPSDELVLYGNVDLRQVALAFNNNERIKAVLVQEGDRVTAGQVVAQLDTGRLEPQVAQAEAQAAAQRQALEKLEHGNRPEEIAQSQANVESAQADAVNARSQFDRLKKLSERSQGEAISQQDLDTARSVLAMAEAKLAVNVKAHDLMVAGPRKEDVAEAAARLKAAEAQAAFLRRELADADLAAPVDAIVRTRLMEPGEMASPQRPVFSLAVTNPKWVRAYVSEPDLGKVAPGSKATITVDSFPDRKFDGWIGFISPVAEFTPKAIQTEELRTSLVYEVRAFVTDPKDELRLGMPATVRLALTAPQAPTKAAGR